MLCVHDNQGSGNSSSGTLLTLRVMHGRGQGTYLCLIHGSIKVFHSVSFVHSSHFGQNPPFQYPHAPPCSSLQDSFHLVIAHQQYGS